jgi:serine/threonine protein kinase
LHDKGISHRDLKPENILLSSFENNETLIKVTDFGLSKIFSSKAVMQTFCGTPNYLAPEVLTTRGMGTYTNKIDNWSLGVILYICLVGYSPFNEDGNIKLEKQIERGIYDFPEEDWSTVSNDARDLVCKLLCVNDENRYSLNQVLQHDWIRDDFEMKGKVHKLMYPDEPEPKPELERVKGEVKVDSINETDPIFTDDNDGSSSESTELEKLVEDSKINSVSEINQTNLEEVPKQDSALNGNDKEATKKRQLSQTDDNNNNNNNKKVLNNNKKKLINLNNDNHNDNNNNEGTIKRRLRNRK